METEAVPAMLAGGYQVVPLPRMPGERLRSSPERRESDAGLRKAAAALSCAATSASPMARSRGMVLGME